QRATDQVSGTSPSGVIASMSFTSAATSSSSGSASAASSPARPAKARISARSPNAGSGHLRDTHVQAVIVAGRPPATVAPAGTMKPVASGSSEPEPGPYAIDTTADDPYAIRPSPSAAAALTPVRSVEAAGAGAATITASASTGEPSRLM